MAAGMLLDSDGLKPRGPNFSGYFNNIVPTLLKRWLLIAVVATLSIVLWLSVSQSQLIVQESDVESGALLADSSQKLVIVITPTHKRAERLADFIRFSQTLMLVKDIFWIVVEDGNLTSPALELLLNRTGIPYVYLHEANVKDGPIYGNAQRNKGLAYARERFGNPRRDAVVYFADDDNSYDYRLFDKFIRKVTKVGMWAVALCGGAFVEAQRVENNTIVAWDVNWAPNRKFGIDMAGFAVHLDLFLSHPNATFHRHCDVNGPEGCILEQVIKDKSEVTPFGHDEVPRWVYAWHTKTAKGGYGGSVHNYTFEL